MARKPRQNRYFPEKTEAKWKAGLYARLSVSDNRVYGESLIYQLKLAQEFLLSKADISFVKNYVDATDIIGLKQNPTNGRRFSPIFSFIGHFSIQNEEMLLLKQRRKTEYGKDKSILVSCGARLAPFDIAELREITMYDELELDTLGDKIFVNPKNKKDTRYYKTALFLIMSDTDSTFNFLISMIYTQLFNLLCLCYDNGANPDGRRQKQYARRCRYLDVLQVDF